jgi:ribonuclease HI
LGIQVDPYNSEKWRSRKKGKPKRTMEWLLHKAGPPQWKLYANNRVQWRQASAAFLANARHELDGSGHRRPKREYRQRVEGIQGEKELWKLSDRLEKVCQTRVRSISQLVWPTVRIYGDCRPLSKTMAGRWRRGDNRATGVIRETAAWWQRVFKVAWTGQDPFKDIRRKKNKEADKLANKGADGQAGFWIDQKLWLQIYRRAGAGKQEKAGQREGCSWREGAEGKAGNIRLFFDGAFRSSTGSSGYGSFADFIPKVGPRRRLFEKYGPTDAKDSYEAESQAAGEGVLVFAKMLVDAVGGAMDIKVALSSPTSRGCAHQGIP